MNIIVVVVDTLRYDYIRACGANDWIETPNFDALAAQSLLFDWAFAASYPTIPHRTDMLTGEYAWAYRGPFHPWMPLPFDVLTLPRLLAQAGYATQLIHDTPHMVNGGHAFDWPFSAWTFVRGGEVDRPWIDDAALEPLDNWGHDALFDFVDPAAMWPIERRLLLTYSRANRKRRAPEDWNAAQLFLKGAEFLRDNASRGETREGSFLLWLDCFDPHEPWDAPPDFVKRYDADPGYEGAIDPRAFLGQARHPKDGAFPPGVRERLTAHYAAKVTWVDHWFGKVMEALVETGLERKTTIVVTADHGTNLGERGGFGKTQIVNEQEAHVPLLIHMPGGPVGRSAAIVQPQDIAATILGIAGVDRPAAWDGRDLLAVTASGETRPRDLALAGHAVVSWRDDPRQIVFSVFDRDWYMNFAADPAACRLFRYGSVDDVARDHPDLVARMREAGLQEAARRGTDPRLVAWLRSGGEAPFPEPATEWFGPSQWRTYWGRVYDEVTS
ncbi:MAG: sulfatase [Anaerolineae bacterium]|nr:sulfatase [Anaerolineae bacterium]